MSLNMNVEALERQNSQRGRRPPINDAVPLSSCHTKTDELKEREYTDCLLSTWREVKPEFSTQSRCPYVHKPQQTFIHRILQTHKE